MGIEIESKWKFEMESGNGKWKWNLEIGNGNGKWKLQREIGNGNWKLEWNLEMEIGMERELGEELSWEHTASDSGYRLLATEHCRSRASTTSYPPWKKVVLHAKAY